MMKKIYRITLTGCDDETEFLMELREEEASLLDRVSAISKVESTSRCMPDLEIREVIND